MIGRIAWMICAVLVCAAANAQVEPAFRRIGTPQGLPSNGVLDLMQDREGYLWMATTDGLARFDGIGFKMFQNDPNDPDSIPCNDVQTVFEDSRARLWLGCADRGLSMMRDRDGGRFTRFEDELKRLGFDNLDVFTIAESRSGDLWLGTFRRGVLRMDSSGRLQRLQDWMNLPPSLNNRDVLELHVDRSGDLWLATTAGLWRVRNIEDPRQARAEPVLATGIMLSIFESASGSLWFGSDSAAYRIEPGADAATMARVSDVVGVAMIDGIAEDAGGGMWFGTRSGLLRTRPDRSAQLIGARAAVTDSLPAARIQDLLVDHEGGLWIATRAEGLAYLRPDRDNFDLIRHDVLDPSSLPPGILAGVDACPDGRVYVASTFGGLAQIDATGAVRRIGQTPLKAAEGTNTFGLMCDPSGQIWLGRTGSVARLDPDSGSMRVWGEAEGVVAGFVDLLAAGHDGDVWLSSLGTGISRIDRAGRVRTWQTFERGIAIADFEQISVAADGRVWLADAAGMRVLDTERDVFRPLEGGPRQRVTAFAFDRDGSLWTASTAALEHWRIDGFSMQRISLIGTEQGMPAVDVYAMLIDPSGNIWLTSSRGMWRAQREPAALELIDSRRGLPSLQYTKRPTLRMVGEKVMTSAQEGLLRFDPLKQTRIAIASPLRLQSASIRRGEIRVDLDPRAERWQLRWDDRDLRVEARVLSFADPAENHYGFFLEGHDAEWMDTAARPEREFTRIEAGTYRLRIRALNVADVAARNELLHTLVVETPPWLRWQAWLAYASLGAALIWMLIDSWRRRIERRHRLMLAEERRLAAEQANKAKSDFLADVGHEIRTPMAGVLGMTDLLERSALDSNQHRWTLSIKRSGEHMLRLINDLLDLSRIEAGQLELSAQAIDIRALVEEIRALEAPLADARGIAFTAEVGAELPQWIQGDGRRLKQILLNLVNNALKFTERGRVGIQIAQTEPGWLSMRVNDTGPGMSADQLAQLFARFRQTESGKQKGGSGLGLAITAQLVRLLGGSIDVQSAPGEGTAFSVRLPMTACAAPEDVAAPALAGSDPLAGIEVLLVEDDAAIREVNARLLEDLGATVDTAPHALDALSRFKPTQHRLVFLDLDLPGIDGFALVGLLKAKAAGLLAIAITARSGADTEQRCYAANFDGFMRKPVSAEQLREAAQRWREQVNSIRHLAGTSSA